MAGFDYKSIQDIATNGNLLNQVLSQVVDALQNLILPTSKGGTGQTYGGVVPKYTTAERDALTSTPDGLMIYNTSTNKFQGRASGAWVDLH